MTGRAARCCLLRYAGTAPSGYRTEGAGLSEFAHDQWTRFGINEGLPSEYVWSVLETATGQLLISTWGAGWLPRAAPGFNQSKQLGS